MRLDTIVRMVSTKVLKPGDVMECLSNDFNHNGFVKGENYTIDRVSDIAGGCIFLDKNNTVPFWPGFFKKV